MAHRYYEMAILMKTNLRVSGSFLCGIYFYHFESTTTHLWTLHILDPLVRLSLRVHHQRPAAPSRHYHTVLRGETVARQPLNVPISHLRWVDHEIAEAEVFTARHSQFSHLPHTTRDEKYCINYLYITYIKDF